jgi:hypothetical protein
VLEGPCLAVGHLALREGHQRPGHRRVGAHHAAHAPGAVLAPLFVVRWLGMTGGHSGRPSAPPAGATVLARGLERVVFAAEVLRAQREKVAQELASKK